MEKLFDVWEGSLDIDEAIIRAGGIVGLLIRLNHMSGGHHMDANFTTQWLQAINFLRAPYFVYNPWTDGRSNFNWLMAHLPKNDVTLVAADVEVVYKDYSAEKYADEVQLFTDLVMAQVHMVMYTGQWFLPYLSHWPVNCEYWWARYPNAFYPDESEVWTYEKLDAEVHRYGWSPDPQKKCAGTIKLWQLSGDRLKMPGCVGRAVDVNTWRGDLASLNAWWGGNIIPPMPTLEERVAKLETLAKEHGWM